ncbi:dihydropteroate synthase [Helicobacter bilis]|uniref:dihydropteroate synthase n=1 Tax=Helicobacter bilis TaxID=37372 RepID=UPI0006907180|nr:dihydropteroate synthase [Helicobacter bilis]TLE08388.1 dihydropteroate synthase [Helicobacter bilis]
MKIERVTNINEAMKSVEPDNIGYKIMKEKTQILAFKIEQLKLQAMQILKQDALSNGAELVTPKDAILCQKTHYDCLLFGTQKALKLLISKMQMQPFGLKTIAQELKIFLQPQEDYGRKIMGIINVDSNSFYKEFSSKEAIGQIYHYIDLGIDYIDIGAASSRPGAKYIESKVELERLKPIFKEINKLNTKAQFSIDTYNEETAKIAVEYGFSIINDISGKPENMIKVLQENPHVSYILTHIQGTPKTMQKHCKYKNLILDIDAFFTKKIAFLKEHNCNNIILDVGIGFAKDMQQNINLIHQLKHFRHFNLPLLIGASHKSFLTRILESQPFGRVQGVGVQGKETLESSITSSGTQGLEIGNLDSNPCHVERSEVSNIESKKDFSPFSKAQNDKILESTQTNHANKTTNSSGCSMALEALSELEGRSYLNDNDCPSNSLNRSNCIDKGEFLQNTKSTKKGNLPATLIAHCIAWQNGANIVRVHDVKEHIEALRIMEALRANDIDLL